MPYEPTLNDLERLVAESFNDKDIAENADQAGLAQERFIKLLSDNPKEIWDAAAKQQVQVERLEAEYETKLTARITKSLEREARLIRALKAGAYLAVPTFSFVYLGLWYFKVTTAGLGMITQRPLWLVLTIIAGAFITVFGYYLFRNSGYGSEEYNARERIEKRG